MNTARNVRLLAALVIMIGYLWAQSRLAVIDHRFFVRSPGGVLALARYLLGDYPAAGRAYLALGPGRATASPSTQPPEDDAAVDRLLAQALREARGEQIGQSVRTMHRVLCLDSLSGGSATSTFEVLRFTGDLLRAPAGERPLALLATLHAYLGRFDPAHDRAARASAVEAIARGDLVAESHVTLSILHSAAGELVESRAAVRRAFALDPRHSSALVWAGTQARRQHDVLAEHRFLRAAWSATRDPAAGDALERLLTELRDDHALQALARERRAERGAREP